MALLQTFRTKSWLLAGLVSLSLAGPTLAQEGQQESNVPLAKVVLFNSGVGYFEHLGQVEGDSQLLLKFDVNDINDLLKSMVLQDLAGGRISSISYGSKDPITRTLQTFAIDLTNNPTLGQLLGQIRGENVEVEAPEKTVGTILGVETRQEAGSDGQLVPVEYLNLLTEDGLRSLALPSLGRIRLVDEQLNADLRQALTILALGHATDKKSVAINFVGEGQRPVRVGYIQESPIWKTSYRLVLRGDEEPLIQGWAIVENTTEQDWSGVELTLVSGRPISFVMNLYDPLYVARPLVEPELFASLRPQTYDQDLQMAEQEFAERARQEQAYLADAAPAAPPAPGAAFGGGMGGMGGGFRGDANGIDGRFNRAMDPGRGVQSVAQAQNVGELFHYAIEGQVSIARQQSAMLPIVNGPVEVRKLSIYNPAVHAVHPLNGLRLKNTTGMHLMQGPITVFDEGAYAGDAQIEDLTPDTERLISYALDLNVEVAPETINTPNELVSVKIVKGIVETTYKYQRSQVYVIKNSADEDRTVLIEYPHDPSWTLVQPAEPTETTRDKYRFEVVAEPGKPARLAIAEEMVQSQSTFITNVDDGTIQFYLNARVVSQKVKDSLQEVIRRKREIEALALEMQQRQQEIDVIGQEQARIRENMAQLDRASELYKRYVTKFGEQEDKIETLRDEIAGLQTQLDEKRAALDEFLANLTLE